MVSKLLGLSLMAQLIPLFSILYLAKIVSVEDIGSFSFFFSISSIFSTFLSLKLENSFVLIKKPEERISMLNGILVISVIITLICYLFLFVVHFSNVYIPKLGSLIFLIPIYAFISNTFIVFNEIVLSRANLTQFGKNKILFSFTSNSIMIIFVHLHIKNGLIYGSFFGMLLALFIIGSKVFRIKYFIDYLFNMRCNMLLIFDYINFVKFYLPGQFINTLAGHLPSLIITNLYGVKFNGYYAMCERILGSGYTLFSGVLRDFYKGQLSSVLLKIDSQRIFNDVLKVSALVSISSIVLYFSFSKYLVNMFLGADWFDMLFFSDRLVFVYALSLITTPIAFIMVYSNKQKIDLYWQLSQLFIISIISGFSIAYLDIYEFLIAYVIVKLLSYVLQFYLSVNYQKSL